MEFQQKKHKKDYRIQKICLGVSLALVGHSFSDGVTIKMPYGVDVLHRPVCTPSFLIGLVKTESGFIARSVETGLGI